jgi:hypothetical protein
VDEDHHGEFDRSAPRVRAEVEREEQEIYDTLENYATTVDPLLRVDPLLLCGVTLSIVHHNVAEFDDERPPSLSSFGLRDGLRAMIGFGRRDAYGRVHRSEEKGLTKKQWEGKSLLKLWN